MSHWFDITRPVRTGMQVYAPEEGYAFEQQKTIGPDSDCNLSRISMGCHCGTHMDAPAHFLEDGATIETIDPELLTGPARVATVTDEAALPNLTGVKRLILRMRTPGLSIAQCEALAASEVRLLGVDLLSICTGAATAPGHRIVLGAGIWIIETLDLTGVPDGDCELVCLPLKLEGREAAPARALVRPL